MLAEALGKVYALISQSNGKVIAEEFREETGYFLTNAIIPMLHSFGFADGKLIVFDDLDFS